MNQQEKELLLGQSPETVDGEIDDKLEATHRRELVGIKLATQLDVIIGITIQMSVLLMLGATLVFSKCYICRFCNC